MLILFYILCIPAQIRVSTHFTHNCVVTIKFMTISDGITVNITVRIMSVPVAITVNVTVSIMFSIMSLSCQCHVSIVISIMLLSWAVSWSVSSHGPIYHAMLCYVFH